MQVSTDWIIETIMRKRGSIIFTGPNGVGKTLLAIQVVEKALREGRKCVYALTTMAPPNLFGLGKVHLC
ncbi:MAG: ATP-binding protein [Candidatus Caldarchaeum sp.]|uniref:IstB-like ATP-binding domain-containing protein n=1 Tax=Caldiarchaeum subterraneum TaxID=311458 RepID=A0A7C5Q4J8_CALS0